MLLVFLLTLACVVFASLYVDVYRKNKQLLLDVKRLESTQVLLMVPDDQAAEIAQWLETHPDQTQAIIKMSKQSNIDDTHLTSKVAPVEPKTTDSDVTSITTDSSNHDNSNNNDNNVSTPVIVSENENGVKVIKLPHGGIIVTTRDDNKDNKKTK